MPTIQRYSKVNCSLNFIKIFCYSFVHFYSIVYPSMVVCIVHVIAFCRQIAQQAVTMLSTVRVICVNVSWSLQDSWKKQNGSTGNLCFLAGNKFADCCLLISTTIFHVNLVWPVASFIFFVIFPGRTCVSCRGEPMFLSYHVLFGCFMHSLACRHSYLASAMTGKAVLSNTHIGSHLRMYHPSSYYTYMNAIL